MHGDDKPLDELRREVQQLAEQVKQQAEQLRAIKIMLEERDQH